MDQAIKKRITRIIGPVPDNAFHDLGDSHIIVKPNSFSESGILIDQKVLQPITYGKYGVIPVSMTYGLTLEQINSVLENCLAEAEVLETLFRTPKLSQKIATEITEELALCFQSLRHPDDKGLHVIIKRLPLKNRSMYKKIIKILLNVKDYDVMSQLVAFLSPMHSSKAKFGIAFLEKNQEELIEEARKSFVPYLTKSTYEQDHFGIGKMEQDDLMLLGADYDIKASQISYSPLYQGGIDTLPDRMGVQFKDEEAPLDPKKKKRLFEKASKIMRYLEKNDDESVLKVFGGLVSKLNLRHDGIDYNRLILMPSEIDVKVPFIVPVIVDNDHGNTITASYKPIDALNLIVEKMPPDVRGSKNSDKPFPFGASSPLARPKRVKSEIT